MGKFVRIFLIGISALTITACMEIGKQHDVGEWTIYESFTGYSTAVPPGYKYSELAPSGTYYYFGYPADIGTGLRSVDFHDSSIQSCTPKAAGASHMANIPDTGGQTSWGKFDYEFSPDPKIGEGEFFCVPFASTPHVYVMCSEKDEKTVLICVSQVTDNPELAKQIFETFRWTY